MDDEPLDRDEVGVLVPMFGRITAKYDYLALKLAYVRGESGYEI